MRELLTRREAIKTLLVTTATSMAGGKVWASKVVSDVTANAIDPTVGVARILLSSFPALNTNGGSVRLGSSTVMTSDPESIFPVGLFYPVLINRISATEYVALDTNCLHAGCVLPVVSGGINGKITCKCHGSQYDIRGLCLAGPAPVGQSLLSYPTTLANGILSFKLPDPAGFEITQQTVLNGTEKRLQLTWPSFSDVEYEVRYRPNFQTEPVRVNLAKALNGAATATFIVGDAVEDHTSCWILPQDGIYQVAIRLRAA